MEDPKKKRAHSVPSNYITLQQLQEQRLKEQQKQEQEEEEERQRQLEKQREEGERKESEKQHAKSIQTQRIKAPGGADSKKSSRHVKFVATEGEIHGQKVVEAKNEKRKKKKWKGEGSVDAEKLKRGEGSPGNNQASTSEITREILVSSAEIIHRIVDLKVSDHGEIGRVGKMNKKSTAKERQAKVVTQVTAVRGEKTADGSDGGNGNVRYYKSGRFGRNQGSRRKPEPAGHVVTAVDCENPQGLDRSNRADEGFAAENSGAARQRKSPRKRREQPPSRQIVVANTAKICSAVEADAKYGGRTEFVHPTAVFGADDISTAESKSTSLRKPLVFAAAELGKLNGSDGVYPGSAVKSRSREKPEGLDGSDRGDEGFVAENSGAARQRNSPRKRQEQPPLRQIVVANTAKIGGAVEADGKDGAKRTEFVRSTAVFGADEESTVESKSKSQFFAGEELGKLNGRDGVHAGSTVKIRILPRREGRYTTGRRGGFRGRGFGRSSGSGFVWIRKDEVPDAGSLPRQVAYTNTARGGRRKSRIHAGEDRV